MICKFVVDVSNVGIKCFSVVFFVLFLFFLFCFFFFFFFCFFFFFFFLFFFFLFFFCIFRRIMLYELLREKKKVPTDICSQRSLKSDCTDVSMEKQQKTLNPWLPKQRTVMILPFRKLSS